MPFFSMYDATHQDVDMELVRSGLFLGSQQAEEAPVITLKNYGITHVVQLGTDNVTMCPSHPDDFRYLCITIADKDEVDLIEALRRYKALEFMDTALQQQGSILVHCQMGMSRSATTVMAYLITRERLSFWDALVQTISARRRVQPNPGFCRQLKSLANLEGDLMLYKGPDATFITNDFLWLQLIDKAQTAAVVDLLRSTQRRSIAVVSQQNMEDAPKA